MQKKAIDRIVQILDYKGLRISALEKKLNLGNQTLVRSLERKSSLKEDVLNKVLILYPEIDPVWLLTGKGDMLLGDSPADLRVDQEQVNTLIETNRSLSRTIELLSRKL